MHRESVGVALHVLSARARRADHVRNSIARFIALAVRSTASSAEAPQVGFEWLGPDGAVVTDLDQRPEKGLQVDDSRGARQVAAYCPSARRWECRRARRSGRRPRLRRALEFQQIGLGLVGCVPVPAIEDQADIRLVDRGDQFAHLCHRVDEGGISSRTTMFSGRRIPARGGFHGPGGLW